MPVTLATTFMGNGDTMIVTQAEILTTNGDIVSVTLVDTLMTKGGTKPVTLAGTIMVDSDPIPETMGETQMTNGNTRYASNPWDWEFVWKLDIFKLQLQNRIFLKIKTIIQNSFFYQKHLVTMYIFVSDNFFSFSTT